MKNSFLNNHVKKAKKTDKKDVVAFLLCLLFAVALWLLVVGQNPEMQHELTYYEVPVTIKNDKLSDHGLSIISGYDYTVNITVKGSRSKLSSYTRDDIVASVDVGSIDVAKEYRLPIDVSFPPSSGFELVTKSIDDIPVIIDKQTSKTIAVTVGLDAIWGDDIHLSTEWTVSPETVVVTGPERLLDRLSFANVSLELGKIESAGAYNFNKPITLLDSNKNEIDMRYMTIDNDYATGTISIITMDEASEIIPKTVKLSVDIDPSISQYYDIKISPEQVILRGRRDDLENVKSISIMTVDKTKNTSDSVYKLPIKAPDGTYIDSELREATVQISLSKKITSRTLTLNNDLIEIENDTDLTIGVQDKNIFDGKGKMSITLFGEKELLDELLKDYDESSGTFDDLPISFFIDASLITKEGIYKLPLSVKFKNSKYKQLWMEYIEVYITVSSDDNTNE